MRRANSGIYRWLLLLPGPIVLVVLLTMIDVSALLTSLRQVDALLFGCAGLMLLTTVPMRTYRWRLLLGELVEELPPFRDMLSIYAYATFVGIATPGRIGEFVKVLQLRQYGISAGAATANVLTDRLLDIVSLLVIALVAFVLMVVPGTPNTAMVVLVVVGSIAGAIGGWVLLRSEAVERTFAAQSRKLWTPLRSLADRAATITRNFRHAIRAQSARVLLIASLPTFVGWAVVYAANFLIARSIELHLSYPQIAGISSLSSLAAQLPATVMGLGTRDAALILLLQPLGIPEEDALALSFLFLASILFVAAGCAPAMLSSAVVRTRATIDEARSDGV